MDRDCSLASTAEDALRLIDQLLSELESTQNEQGFHDTCKELTTRVSRFETAPNLLDRKLEKVVSYVSRVFLSRKRESLGSIEDVSTIFYTLCRVRGTSKVTDFLDSDVRLLVELTEYARSTNSDFETHFLFLWLSRLAMVPFPLHTIETGIEHVLLEMARKKLSLHNNASRTQHASLLFLSALLSRPDCSQLLESFIQDLTESWLINEDAYKLGSLMVLNKLLKRVSNQTLSVYCESIYSLVQKDILRVRFSKIASSVHVLYLIKISTKLAQSFTKQRAFERVAQLINHLINDLMNSTGDRFDMTLRTALAKNLAKITNALRVRAPNYSNQVTEFMIRQLRVGDTENYRSDLRVSDKFNAPVYHAVLLYMGFLALTRSLDRVYSPIILSVVHKTLFTSSDAFATVKSVHVRDASCFVLWALWKYSSHDALLESHNTQSSMFLDILEDLVKVVVFDEDFTIRRCAVAVIQEVLGRLSFFLKDVTSRPVGEFSLGVVDLIGDASIGLNKDSFGLIEKLVAYGFSPAIFQRRLMAHLQEKGLTQFQKLCARHLPKVVGDFESSVVTGSEMLSKLLIVMEFLDTFDEAALYALSELQRAGSLTQDEQRLVDSKLVAKNEATLHWYALLCWRESMWPCLLANAFSNSDDVFDDFATIFSKFTAISHEMFEEVLDKLTRGSFPFAKSIFGAVLNESQLKRVLELTQKASVNADVRSILISNVGHYVHFEITVNTILALLDDYTITEQGDVGLKVRSVCLSLVKEHSLPGAEEKIIRLCGEILDRIRYQAFEVWCNATGEPLFEMHKQAYTINYATYFRDLFEVYRKLDTDAFIVSFWRGIVHTLGAETGSASLINESFVELLHFLRKLPASVNPTFRYLTKLLYIPDGRLEKLCSRDRKCVFGALNTLLKLFDALVQPTAGFDFTQLYVRVYNASINTKSRARIKTAFLLFSHLLLIADVPKDVKKKVLDRLIRFAGNPKAHLRQFTGTILADVTWGSTAFAEIEELDWTDADEAARGRRTIEMHCGIY